MTDEHPSGPDTHTDIQLYDSAADVAEALATRLIARVTQLQQEDRTPQIALTGGRIAIQAYERLAADGRGSAVDWSRVELWWGDERFVPADDDDRNDKSALNVLTGSLEFDPALIHQMPASDAGPDLNAAAAAYAAELGDTAFDICLLGMGPDGHVASLFPDHPSSSTPGDVIAVRDSPKPPPDRISLTMPVINRSREVWFLVSGADKADAVSWAITGSRPVPAAEVSGVATTVWLIDRAAASELSS